MTFKREYSALQSLISADYFNTSWAELPEGLLQRLYKFYAARARYLRELPSRLRPTHAKGDGAFESLLVQLRQAGGDLAERALRPYPPKSNWRGEMQALRAQLDEDFASPYDPSKQPTPEFNPERAFEALKELVELNANLPLIQDKAREMLERGVSPADPRMIAILRDHAGDLSGPRFKSLRAKIRKAIRDEAKRAVETPAPTQIPCAGALDGKRIALIGGDRRGTLTTWLQQQLPHAEIDWVETSRRSGVRQAQALVDRMNHGGVDFVLLIQEFMGHHISGSIIEAAKGAHSSVCVTYVRNGYGQAQVIEALERCLSQEDDRP